MARCTCTVHTRERMEDFVTSGAYEPPMQGREGECNLPTYISTIARCGVADLSVTTVASRLVM